MENYLPNLFFAIILIAAIGYFVMNVRKLIRNIKLGKDVDRTDRKPERWKNMAKIALGQYKMVRRPVSGILHVVVYVGFILINIEMLEIVIDGLLGTHRVFQPIIGNTLYGFLIGNFEVLSVLVLISVTIFWFRRNIEKVKRFWNKEMEGWPKNDGNIILYFEMVLMSLFLVMNATDVTFQEAGVGNVVSQFIAPWFDGFSNESLHTIEKTAWWLHIIGILIFLNYLYYSKHLHILLAFPNTFYANLKPKGQFNNLEAVTKEVKMMMDPDADPYAMPEDGEEEGEPEKFGASDVTDLNWVQLMNAYTCTECGRCTSSCPANLTGKELSPRAIMMKTRDRLEEVGKNIDANGGTFKDDGKQLLNDYITPEELWACTSCNACVQECPIGIDPLSIIMDMRRYLVMEESAAPQELNMMMTNIENNGAPWQYSQMDRLNWKDEE
ncbi:MULTISPECIES: 4Fe-4S dicluster domain-containing protein [Tenacibaculum]|uniref:(Fe-S)-binding protein n=2 Tax=Tenacibaculum TaxID=104267 RepID=A0AAE9MM34_9FLAO|nr:MULTISPECIES: 4Fe-4S dicluster domain-containing protein [Tenacibaculum]AZJ31345.1 (Fe-S)-binding protein [Tenacibaculum mesophilum]MCG7503318.1 4Fe-4S dicluster domain-containing protein [Tenacibaculum sp. Mcav3-52]MCO7186582.1 4Fe-4S dicluster domain-containing protein [Tenacibaculum sp. XPcli2-G]QFS29393.1 4Fe-4S dicluster domain-containing protein [Tenacibaculum mesophilum]UTD14020.1 4Fe-4S dicluster domain-containing protein [Tenacibaculum mesophilum]|eukprot:TRINITY_DN2845_c0_g2_i1.p1 TRINITY_DN2845_c0_g2~~TRINITY_DN2845_c0_g2_i1.p1  ORF type:complete len:440 (+),score=69.32 TRINITY_DN2845_c0_g2_i1:1300-2619(+)